MKKFLKTIPRSKFIQIIVAIEHVLDLNQTSFKDVVQWLKEYEEIINDDDHVDSSQSKLLFSKDDRSSSKTQNYPKRGSKGSKGKGKGKATIQRKSQVTGDGGGQHPNKVKSKKDK